MFFSVKYLSSDVSTDVIAACKTFAALVWFLDRIIFFHKFFFITWSISAKRSCAKRLIGTSLSCVLFYFFSFPISTLRSDADGIPPPSLSMQILDVYDAVMKYDGCDKIRPLNRYAMIQREKRKKKNKTCSCKWTRQTGACGGSMTYSGFFELIEGLPLLLASQAFLLLVQREIWARLRVIRVRRTLKSDKLFVRSV